MFKATKNVKERRKVKFHPISLPAVTYYKINKSKYQRL